MIQVCHAAAACKTVLITHARAAARASDTPRDVVSPASLAGQLERPCGLMALPTFAWNYLPNRSPMWRTIPGATETAAAPVGETASSALSGSVAP
jgi:hypothetical protein